MVQPTPYEQQQAILAEEVWKLDITPPHGLYSAILKAAEVTGEDLGEFVLRAVTPALHEAIVAVGLDRILQHADSMTASLAEHEDTYGSLDDLNWPRLRNRVATDDMRGYLEDLSDTQD